MSEIGQQLVNEHYGVTPELKHGAYQVGTPEYNNYMAALIARNTGTIVTEEDAMNNLRADLLGLLGGSLRNQAPTYTGYIPQPGSSSLPPRTLPTVARNPYTPPPSGFTVPALNIPAGAVPDANFRYNTGVTNNGS